MNLKKSENDENEECEGNWSGKGEGDGMSGNRCVRRTVVGGKEVDVVWDTTAAGAVAGSAVCGVDEVVEDKVMVAVRVAVMRNIVVVVFLNTRSEARQDDWGERKMVDHRMMSSGREEVPPQSWRAPHISVSYPSQFPPFTVLPTLQQW